MIMALSDFFPYYQDVDKQNFQRLMVIALRNCTIDAHADKWQSIEALIATDSELILDTTEWRYVSFFTTSAYVDLRVFRFI